MSSKNYGRAHPGKALLTGGPFNGLESHYIAPIMYVPLIYADGFDSQKHKNIRAVYKQDDQFYWEYVYTGNEDDVGINIIYKTGN